MIGEMEKKKNTRALNESSDIATYLLPKICRGHSMEMSIFVSLAFTEILHLKNTWMLFLYCKIKQCVI